MTEFLLQLILWCVIGVISALIILIIWVAIDDLIQARRQKKTEEADKQFSSWEERRREVLELERNQEAMMLRSKEYDEIQSAEAIMEELETGVSKPVKEKVRTKRKRKPVLTKGTTARLSHKYDETMLALEIMEELEREDERKRDTAGSR